MAQRGTPVRLQVTGKATVVAGLGHFADTVVGDIRHPGVAIAADLNRHPAHLVQQLLFGLPAQQRVIAGTEHGQGANRGVGTCGHVVEGIGHDREFVHRVAGTKANAALSARQPRCRDRKLAGRVQDTVVHHSHRQRQRQRQRTCHAPGLPGNHPLQPCLKRAGR